jgi:hypothetical protein
VSNDPVCPVPQEPSRRVFAFAAVCVFASLAFATLCLFLLFPRQNEQRPPVVATHVSGDTFHGGWVDDADAREAVLQSLPVGQKYFSETPAGKSVRGDDKNVIFSDAAKNLLGRHIPTRNQLDVGSCVSFGSIAAIEYLIALQILERGGRPEEFRDLAQEAMYGLSRVEIGGGKIRGDGSVTAWAAEAARQFGVLHRGLHGKHDLSRYDTKRCRDWGRSGLPDDLEPIAKQSPVKGTTFVRSATEAKRAIQQGYPIAQGSSVGFGNVGPHRRDKDGFLKRSGSWGHCMACIGYIGGKRPGFLILNSWGEDWVAGPTGGHDIPPGSFFVDESTYDSMVKEGDAIAFSDAVGFPAKEPWFFVSKPKPRQEDAVVFAPEIAP